jgi:hypothetical protein
MSYDVSIVDTNGEEVVDCGNYTYNVQPMFKKAFLINHPMKVQNKQLDLSDGLKSLEGLTTYEATQVLRVVLRTLAQTPDGYIKYNPPNGWSSYGWGSYDGAVQFLTDILLACKIHLSLTEYRLVVY